MHCNSLSFSIVAHWICFAARGWPVNGLRERFVSMFLNVMACNSQSISEDYGRVGPRTFVRNSFQGCLGPYDAMALLHYPPWVMTSPNMPHIPFIDLEITELRARADGRFGIEDYAIVPQVHSESYPWLPFVLRQPPTLELRDQHLHGILWDNLRPSDFVCPAGCSFTGLGVVEDGLMAHFARHLRVIEQDVLRGLRSRSYPPQVSFAAAAMMAIVRRLRELPMTFRDLTLQWTQAQRLALDLLAMQAYYNTMFQRLMQRDRVWPLAPQYIGCYTENPTTVENMFYAGIPVVYIRPDNAVSISMLRIRNVVTEFAPLAKHIVIAEWPEEPCTNLHIGASGYSRITMNRPLGRYFEDLPPLPRCPDDKADVSLFRKHSDAVLTGHIAPSQHGASDGRPQSSSLDDADPTFPDDDDFPPLNDTEPDSRMLPDALGCTPEPVASSSPSKTKVAAGRIEKQPLKANSRKARKQLLCEYLSHRVVLHAADKRVDALNSKRVAHVARPLSKPVNRDKWAALTGELMPTTSPEWLSARQLVKRDVQLKDVLLKSQVGMMYPDPGYFNGCNLRSRQTAIAAWLSIRANRCGQMAYPGYPTMPVVSASTWRKFFNIWRTRPSTISVIPPSSANEGTQLHDDATAAAAMMFGEKMMSLMRDSATEVFWCGTRFTVADGAVQDMPSRIIQQITWELMELNWRYEILALDKALAPQKWATDDIANQRVEAILRVFHPDSSFTPVAAAFPTVQPSASAMTPSDRLPALKALREVMWDWDCASDAIRFSLLLEPQTTECDEAAFLESHTMQLYCQTFYEYFHRPPTLPAQIPT